jgi:heme o synthase
VATGSGGTFVKNLCAYVELVKPRILSMVLVTTTIGFFLAARGIHPLPTLLWTLIGVGCATGGSAALNNYLEREVDGRMERTCHRALPAGLIHPSNALAFGISLVLAGVVVLICIVNLLTAFLVLLASFLYVLVYTPMKRLTWLNTTFGAIPGAIPPMCGWAAANGRLDPGAWVLFLILFAWEHPHFYAIAWMFRDDYRNAGFKMLPVVDPTGASTFRQTMLFAVLLLGVSVLPTVIGMTGRVYCAGAIVMGAALLAVGLLFTHTKTFLSARRLLKASIVYLPLLLLLIIVDSGL